MLNKQPETGYYTKVQDDPKNTVFKFPTHLVLSKKWFLNRLGYEISKYSVFCVDHFEVKFIIQHVTKYSLNYSLNPFQPSIQVSPYQV